MQNPSIRWSQGMFLRPQHFQAADRHWLETHSAHLKLDHPYGYGLYKAGLSEASLQNGILELRGLQLRMRDGTLVMCPDDEVLSVDIKSRLAEQQVTGPISVYLGIPKNRSGLQNVGSTFGGTTRFVASQREVADDEDGGNLQTIDYRILNYRILLSIEERGGFDTVPLVRLLPQGAGSFRVDDNYFPPCVSTQSWPELDMVCRDLKNFIGSRIQTMSTVIRDRGISLSSQVAGDLEKLLLLHVINECYTELSCLCTSQGVHPHTMYSRLAAMVGRCCIFDSEPKLLEIPKYDHDDLATIFRWISLEIRRLINSVKEDDCVQRYFVGRGRGMHVALEPEWLGPEWVWYFGVNPVNCTPEECRHILAQEIDMKIASADSVEHCMTHRQPGLRLRGIRQAPSVLSSRGNWLFFEINLENENWKRVMLTQTIGVRIREDQISNLDSLEGNRKIHLAIGGRTVGLEFAIFAIKQRL